MRPGPLPSGALAADRRAAAGPASAPRRLPARGWGLAVVLALHLLLLGWAWTRSLAAGAASPGEPIVLVAQLLARAEPAPEPVHDARLRASPAAAPLPKVPALEVPELPAPEQQALVTPAAPKPVTEAAPAPSLAPPPGAASLSPATAEPRPAPVARAAPPTAPAAPRRQPADHAGCAEVPHPLALRERGIEGLVQLRVQVGSDGRARQVQLLGSSGWRLFDEAALAKARSCRFRPAFEGDTAVESWVEFPVRFALAQS